MSWNSRCPRCKGIELAHPNNPDGCDCPYPQEPTLDLEPHGYVYSADDGVWEKLVSSAERVARRDHKSGKIRKGDRYYETVYRYIEDATSEQRLTRKVHKADPDDQ